MQFNKDPPPPYSSQPLPGVHQHYDYYQPTAPPPNIYRHPSYGTTTIIVPEPEVIIIGACPACRIGVLEDNYTCLGLLLAILFFPAGILCCLLLKDKRCSNCGATFG
ncbi:unnamed protein product [Phaedon cochleariae]|uniref:Membrane protein BRI3 n=1 Tax=Phaedon cochleariae TaxID=80249 RepID=A0A9P0GTT7_PHACE|nr:unnamed protein product [Phaedon cochleariae]